MTVLALLAIAGPLPGVVKPKPKRKAPVTKPVSRSKKPVRSGKKSRTRSLAQAQPTPDRYKEIQQALADKGYYKGDVNGKWNADSVNALKRFQSEQNLSSDGKLNSLSLIALGLGPKRQSMQAQPGAHP
jgi:peptidoglycan hydrolase-like protein with peptidoglycan-binding domain